LAHVDLRHVVQTPPVDFASDRFGLEPLGLEPSHPENDVLGVVLVVPSITGHDEMAHSF
jgi:hypothetical protein